MESVLKPSKPRCGLTGNGNGIVTRRGFHRSCMSFLNKNLQITFQITLISALPAQKSNSIDRLYRPLNCICIENICRVSWHFQFFVGVEVSATWHPGLSQWRPLFVDSRGQVVRSQNRTKCVKYVWLSYPTWPSRWVLCISMQWLRLKGCHVACDEWTSGEICSLQHMWVTGSVMWAAASDESLKLGASATNWFPRVNGARDNGIRLYYVCQTLEIYQVLPYSVDFKAPGELWYSLRQYLIDVVSFGIMDL